jgi:hypothetical protein
MTLEQFIADYRINDGDTYEIIEEIIGDFFEQVEGDYDMHNLVDWIACELDCSKSDVYDAYDAY